MTSEQRRAVVGLATASPHQPVARASPSVQDHVSPFEVSTRVRAYDCPPGTLSMRIPFRLMECIRRKTGFTGSARETAILLDQSSFARAAPADFIDSSK